MDICRAPKGWPLDICVYVKEHSKMRKKKNMNLEEIEGLDLGFLEL